MASRSLMRAVRVSKFGAPDVMKVDTSVPVPVPADNQILVEVKAAGINPVDTYIRAGAYPVKPQLPFTPGNDGSGIVRQIGSKVTKVKPGDKIYFVRSLTGSYAQYLTTEEKFVGLLGDTLTFQHGAGIGIPCFTAYRALCLNAKSKLKPGNSILVHGASGSVGLACVQIAAARGLKVLGTAGSKQGLDLVKKHGASGVFNHKEEDYTDKIMEETNGAGPDLIIEMLANVNLEKDLNMINKNGMIMVIGNRGTIEINPRLMMQKESTVQGLNLWNMLCVVGNRGTVEINPRITMHKECMITGMSLMNTATQDEWAELHLGVAEGIQSGWLVPYINKEYSLDEASQAHEDIINGGPALGRRVFVL